MGRAFRRAALRYHPDKQQNNVRYRLAADHAAHMTWGKGGWAAAALDVALLRQPSATRVRLSLVSYLEWVTDLPTYLPT